MLDTLHLGRGKPMMTGLLELDVTRARRLLREHCEATGESLSFTAFLLACVGRAVAAYPEVHAVRDWLGRVVLFDDVDATVIVEVQVDGRSFPLAHVLRGVNRRTARDLHQELRSVQAGGLRTAPRGLRVGARLLLMVPGVLRRLVYRALLRSPRRAKRLVGTVLVSAVGMFGGGAAGWGLSAPGLHNFSLVVGAIAPRPLGPTGEAAAREVLCLTVSANHDLVDGAPLARFASDLARRVAAADGLGGAATEPAPAPAEPPAPPVRLSCS